MIDPEKWAKNRSAAVAAIIYGRNGVKQKMKSITSSIYVH